MINYIEYLNVPTTIAITIVGLFLVLQIVGELLEFKGKVVPEFVKIRKYFIRKGKEKNEATQTLKDVQTLLGDVNAHYSADNIAKRDSWMTWVNNRAEIYDNSIDKLSETLSEVTQALRDNTKMTEELFIQSSRDRVIDFATKVGDNKSMVSREEFNRIFKVYTRYEEFLKERGLTNGEIEIANRIIEDAYASRLKNHNFIEDIHGYNTN
jgi:hypothetical protein